MPISDWSTDPNANGNVAGVSIEEGCNARNLNDAIRQVMADVKSYTQDPRVDGAFPPNGIQLMRCDGATGMVGNLQMQGYKVKDIPWPSTSGDNDAVPASWVSAFFQTKIDLLNTVYPAGVGPVIITLSNVNPGTWLGGSWIQICQGRFPIGVGTGTDTRGEGRSFTPTETGGEYNHVLTEAEMPVHSHAAHSTFGVATGGSDVGNDNVNGPRRTGNTGGSGAHNNIPPYLAMYFWQRIG